MKATLFIKNQKGLSLTEICVALCLVGIVGGIGLVSFQKTMSKADISNLCDKVTLFAVGVRNCIMASGGWEVKRYSQAGEDCAGKPDPCIKMTPCKATTTAELKKKLSFICPAKDDSSTGEGCSAVATADYYCLNMKKDKAQVIVHFDIDSKDYKVYSGKPATFETVTTATCVETPTYTISKDEFCGTSSAQTTSTPKPTEGTPKPTEGSPKPPASPSPKTDHGETTQHQNQPVSE